MALRLFGITVLEGQPLRLVSGVTTVPFRDLVAVVDEVPYLAEGPGQAEVDRHRHVVDAIHLNRPVVPAPVGVVFRASDTLTRWMELHYVSLTDALTYVEDRAEARVHITRDGGSPDERQAGTDLAEAAAESLRALRRRAVGGVPLRTEHIQGIVLSSAFLVDRELWSGFREIVEQERERNPGLAYEITGPWPPYDFVRMRFGA